jgi:hypothetical protein
MSRQRTKADMARELDNLRHALSQARADIQRLETENVELRSTRAVRVDDFSAKRDAMQRAKEEAIRTGKCVRVQS